jgi:hypothetical protein
VISHRDRGSCSARTRPPPAARRAAGRTHPVLMFDESVKGRDPEGIRTLMPRPPPGGRQPRYGSIEDVFKVLTSDVLEYGVTA